MFSSTTYWKTIKVVAAVLFLAITVFIFMPNRIEEVEQGEITPVEEDRERVVIEPGEEIESLVGELTFTPLCTEREKRQGLSGKVSLPSNEAYLFVYNAPQDIGIWMKEMHFSIDIYWLDQNERIIHKVAAAPPESYPKVFYSPTPAQFVVETVVGAVDSEVGDTLLLSGAEQACENF